MKLDHIGIAQPDPAALDTLFNDLGLPTFGQPEVLEKQGVAASFSVLPNGITVEKIVPLSEDSTVAKFLQQRGPGLHHLAFLVDDIAAERAKLEAKGYRALSPAPTLGAKGKWVQFFHPKDTAGVLVELCQYA